MTHLLENDTPFVFFEDCIQAFQTLKKKLTEAPILIAPNWDLPFKLMCDASDFAIGMVLGQRHEKHFRPIHYASKTLTDAESNYTTTEKEMLAVVKLGLPDLIPTQMTLELANHAICTPDGIARDVFVPVGKFTFLADFVVVNYESGPRVPLILGRPFLRTARALIDVHGKEMILRDGDERLTLNMNHDIASYSNHPYRESVNLINIFDLSSEDCLKDLVSNKQSGNPTFSLHKEIASAEVILEIHDSKGCTFLSEELQNIDSFNDIVFTTSPTLTPFGDSDFLLFEDVDAFLGLEDDPDSLELDLSYYDPEGDILLLEAILNSDPSPPLPNHDKSMPSFKAELKACEAKTIKSSIDEPPEVELKDLRPHLEYAFLEGDNKLPVIIAKALKDEEKSALIKVLKSHKRAIAWKLSDIQGINPVFYTHKILMEEDYKPAV
nr:reverse transcriptase domain-containing protein [Tanacetum cinerariifolium]